MRALLLILNACCISAAAHIFRDMLFSGFCYGRVLFHEHQEKVKQTKRLWEAMRELNLPHLLQTRPYFQPQHIVLVPRGVTCSLYYESASADVKMSNFIGLYYNVGSFLLVVVDSACLEYSDADRQHRIMVLE